MTSAALSPITTRFAWKEYRTLRGFWLAAFVIAALLQVLSVTLAPARPQDAYAETVFAIALAAAALYAAGVAATTFSMEHEEETYGYLSGLPTRWLPLFAGKLSFAAASSAALALALVTTGWLLAGNLPNQPETLTTLGVFGFAIVEMLLWGTFFSLLVRQPLLAALLTIGVESLALTLAVDFFSTQNLPALTPSSYVQVLPTRLAITACVFAIDVLLARRWMTNESPRAAASPNASGDEQTRVSRLRQIAQLVAQPFSFAARRVEPRVLSHLLWQAWRQSWKPMLAMSVIVPLVCFATLLIFGAGRWDAELRGDQFGPLIFVIMFGAAALYWSVVFHADQRGQKYRFLAEHAAWPRHVWLTRLAVWSLPVFVALAVSTVFLAYGLFDVNDEWRRQFSQHRGNNHWWDAQYLSERWDEVDDIVRGLIYGLWGGLVGAALGQACSMFFRRALVAGFAALVLALPLLVWGAAIWAWELSPLVFFVPIALGLLVATWLRAPDWLVDRNSLTAWLKVGVAFALPIAFVAWRLPTAREVPGNFSPDAIRQIERLLGDDIDIFSFYEPNQIVEGWIANSDFTNTEEQQATADRLLRLAESIERPKISSQLNPERERSRSEIDASAREKIALNPSILQQAAKLARRDYRLSVSDASWNRIDNLAYLLKDAGRIATVDGDLDQALDYHLAALTLQERLWSGQSTGTSLPRNSREQFQAQLVDWANVKGQTTERIKQALDALDAVYPPVEEFRPGGQSVESIQRWSPPPQILVTYESLRDVLAGKAPSNLLDDHVPLADYAAVLANELPFERQRALRTLDLLTINDAALWRGAIWHANQQVLRGWADDAVRTRGEGGIDDIGESLRRRLRTANALILGRNDEGLWIPNSMDSSYPPGSWLRTSWLLRRELEGRRSFGDWLTSLIDTQVAAWGLRQQLALVAYRLDHGSYPESLDQLVPDYLPFVPIDPYSGRPFEYRPEGLPLELRQFNTSLLIEPNTPLLWSVGAGNARVEIYSTVEAVDPDPDPADEALGVRREFYSFSGHQIWPMPEPLVFPLPK